MLFLLAIYTIIVLFVSGTSTGRVMFTSHQPQTIRYDHNRYVIQETEGQINWNNINWRDRSASIGVTREGDEGNYGHFLEMNILGGEAIAGADWTAEGIQIRFSTGHRLFIPKEAFMGGR